MNSFYHGRSSARKWGGSAKDYKEVHDFLDSTKAHVADMRHRSLLHNSWGIFMAEKMFGEALEVPGEYTTRLIPVRLIAERHVMEDLGRIPSVGDYLKHMTTQPWMAGAYKTSGEGTITGHVLPPLNEIAERLGIDTD